MMHRREFLRRSALIAAGVVAADQIDLLEMLAPRRLFALGEMPGYNRGLTGVLECYTSTSVHSISGSTYRDWELQPYHDFASSAARDRYFTKNIWTS
jgi:hypothetical protein